MLINYYLGMAIICTAWIIFLIVFYALWKRIVPKKQSLGAGIGFFAGIGLSVFLFFALPNVYVASGNKEYKKYISFGGGSYTLQNGSKVSVDVPFHTCGVINDTPGNLVLQKVVYGKGVYDGSVKDQLIKPGQQVHSAKGETRVEHFFDEAPQDHTVSGKGRESVVELWLRTEEDYGGFEKSSTENALDELRRLLNTTPASEEEDTTGE